MARLQEEQAVSTSSQAGGSAASDDTSGQSASAGSKSVVREGAQTGLGRSTASRPQKSQLALIAGSIKTKRKRY